jgi:hypothetical protein
VVSSTALSRIVAVGLALAALALATLVVSPARHARFEIVPRRLHAAPETDRRIRIEQQLFGVSPDRLILIAPPGFNTQTAGSRQ